MEQRDIKIKTPYYDNLLGCYVVTYTASAGRGGFKTFDNVIDAVEFIRKEFPIFFSKTFVK